MKLVILYAALASLLGGIAGYALAESLPEGAFIGVMLGGCLGIIAAMRRLYSGTSPSYEAETASIQDDNLITTMRRRLIREASRNDILWDRLQE